MLSPFDGYRDRTDDFRSFDLPKIVREETNGAELVEDPKPGLCRQFLDSKSCEATIWTLLVLGAALIALAVLA